VLLGLENINSICESKSFTVGTAASMAFYLALGVSFPLSAVLVGGLSGLIGSILSKKLM